MKKFEIMNRTIISIVSRRCLPLLLLAGLMLCQLANAEVRLPNVFSSHMVLQQQRPIIIWGWDQPNQNVTVQLGTATRKVQANERGEWKAILPAHSAGGPYTLTVSGSSRVTYEDILVGEVWLCSGQSNMELGIGLAQNATQEIAAANYPNIRLLKIAKRWSAEPQNDIEGTWKVCTPSSVAEGGWDGFSAVAYYFGRQLYQKLNVPIGLIDATWGGTRIESWTPPEGFASVPALKRESDDLQLGDVLTVQHQKRLEQLLHDTEQWLGAARSALQEQKQVPVMPAFPVELRGPQDVENATALFNGMIQPLCPFGLRGAIWYQGEANVSDGMRYLDRMKALINGWREIWGEGDFPFYFVQIAPFNYGGYSRFGPGLWEAQTESQSITNTGMVVINDIGNLRDIHPKNKQEVGRRLSLWALANTYGQSNLVYCGPTFSSMSIEGDKLRLTLNHIGNDLKSRDGQPLTWFEIVDADQGSFVKAEARIDGATIILSAPGVHHPIAMRFAWNILAEPNLINSEGLPAGAFRAGTVPHRLAVADQQVLPNPNWNPTTVDGTDGGRDWTFTSNSEGDGAYQLNDVWGAGINPVSDGSKGFLKAEVNGTNSDDFQFAQSQWFPTTEGVTWQASVCARPEGLQLNGDQVGLLKIEFADTNYIILSAAQTNVITSSNSDRYWPGSVTFIAGPGTAYVHMQVGVWDPSGSGTNGYALFDNAALAPLTDP